MHARSFVLLAACSFALAKVQHTATDTCQIPAAAATAKTESPTSNVPGKIFDRILMVYLETTSFGNATADRMSILSRPVASAKSSSSKLSSVDQPGHLAV